MAGYREDITTKHGSKCVFSCTEMTDVDSRVERLENKVKQLQQTIETHRIFGNRGRFDHLKFRFCVLVLYVSQFNKSWQKSESLNAKIIEKKTF